jgi:hypothetical protein
MSIEPGFIIESIISKMGADIVSAPIFFFIDAFFGESEGSNS